MSTTLFDLPTEPRHRPHDWTDHGDHTDTTAYEQRIWDIPDVAWVNSNPTSSTGGGVFLLPKVNAPTMTPEQAEELAACLLAAAADQWARSGASREAQR